MKKCKICNADLSLLLEYNNQPRAAQYFLDAQTKDDDRGIALKIFQCVACSTVQIPDEPVAYYSHAIRSPSWNLDPFRKKQLADFIQEFGLQGKRIGHINSEPKPEQYSAFTMFNYLEHFPDPRKTLAQLYDNLDDPGVGIIEVPNFDEIIRDRIFGEFIIDHLYYFTEKTLRFVCEASGFDVLRISEIWDGASLSAVVRKRKLLSPSPFIEHQKQLTLDMDKFVEKSGTATLWGAGHQTLMLLTMMKNLEKIPYIVDSFKIKQNKYTHVTHKLVVPPDELYKKPVGGIIVVVGWQYREILKRIDEMNLNPKPAVAVIKKATVEII